MTKFFRKPLVKAIMALGCVLSLTVALLSGLLMVALLTTGEYEGGGRFEESLMEQQLNSDSWDILNNYFDPYEPDQPWRSYFSGGIYTGENSNFRYNVVDADTGYSVLATISGGEKVRMRRELTNYYHIETEVPMEDRYVISDIVFSSDGNTYVYNEESDYFYPVYDENVLAYLNPVTVGDDVFQLGFTYTGPEMPAMEDPVVEPTEVAPIYLNQFHYEYDGEGFFRSEQSYEYQVEEKSYTIIAYVLHDLTARDNYRVIHEISRFAVGHRFDLIGVFAGTFLLALALLILLGCNVGRVNGKDEAVLAGIWRLPSDLALVGCVFLCALWVALAAESVYITNHSYFPALVLAVTMLLCFAVFVVYGILMLCVRVKTHTLVTGSFLHRCWRNGRKLLRKLGRLCGKALGYLPLVWKVGACYGVICLVEFVALIAFSYSFDDMLGFLWFFERVALGLLVMYIALVFRRLKKGAEAIASGDYTTKIDTEHLAMEFKDTAETLNNIQGGMNAAVESRMKSERLKTELITNVSHDIKTPLTSIVSYVDLLKQEPPGSETAREYIEVLDRQSARLKKLVEDLVEASKASTGNIAVHAEAMDLSVVLGQALGEYAERLSLQGLSPVVKVPEGPVMVLADGRLLWRIFDNLLGNAVKYAMPGTRLYVTLTSDSHAIVTFRNISREPLDVSADELMERFVRGDASRHTEGSGLGLSIAKSLTESMGGEFLLSVDGDLFKAAVILPLLTGPEIAEGM